MCGDSPCPYARSNPRRHFGVSNSRLIEKQESVRKMRSGGHRQVVSKVEAEPASSEGVCHLPYGTNTPLIATTTMTSSARKKVESIQASMRDPESPISILLKSNNSPNDSETILIKECTAAAEETIRELQATDTESLSGASQMLEGNRKREHLQELTELIQLYKPLLSSFRLLPNKLLIEIFLLFAQPEDLATYAVPWILERVCQRWRNIALSTPSLWKYLPPVHIGRSKFADQQKGWFAILLSRSSGSTISFHLRTFPNASDSNALFRLVLSHSERWEHVSLDIYNDSLSFASIKGRLSSLRSLEFRVRNSQWVEFDLFNNAPNLKNITLYPRPRSGMFTLPWRQIQSYKEIMKEHHDIGRILLSLSLQLRTLHFTTDRACPYTNGLTHGDLGHITFPNLTSLTFESFSRGSCPHGLLEVLTCPNLRELVYLSFSLHDLSLELQNLIQRSGCNLQSFTFFGGSSENLLAILQLIPSLTDLTINDPTLTHMEMLTWRFDDPPTSWKLVPQLQTLTFIISKGVTDFLNLVGIIAARCDLGQTQSTGVTVLRSLRLRIANNRLFDYTDLLFGTFSVPQLEVRILDNNLRKELDPLDTTSPALVTNLANLKVNDLNINLLYVRGDTFLNTPCLN